MSDVLVRASRDSDVGAVAAIYAHHVAHGLASFEEVAPGTAEMGERRAGVLARGFPYLVAERGGAVVGYAYVSAYRARPGYRFSCENSIYVREDQRRAGIGRALLPVLIDQATGCGLRQMVAVIGDSANRASIDLHARFGFALVGTLPAIGWKLGRWVDSVIMQRALGPGASTPPA